MSTSVGGLLHFRSMGWLIWALLGVVLGVVIVQVPSPEGVFVMPAMLLMVVLTYLRPKCAVQSCYVDQDGAITLIRGGVRIPFDLNHFRYVRMYNSQQDTDSSPPPGMLVLCRDTAPSPWTWVSSFLFPRVDEQRVVLFFSRWRDAEGYLVGPRDMSALFFQACVRAGHPPTILEHSFDPDTWEVRLG